MAACFVNHFGFTILVMLKIDRLIRSRRKTISLIVQANGNLIVRAPLHTPEATIQQWVETKEHWVKSHQKKALTAASKVKPKQFVDGEIFLFLGRFIAHLICEKVATSFKSLSDVPGSTAP